MSVKWSQMAQVGECSLVSTDTLEITLMNDTYVSYGMNQDESTMWKAGLMPKSMVKVTEDGETYWIINRWGTLFN